MKKSDTAKKRDKFEFTYNLFVMIKACLDNNMFNRSRLGVFGVSYEKQLATSAIEYPPSLTPRVRDLSILSLQQMLNTSSEYLFPRNIAEFVEMVQAADKMLEQQLGLPAELFESVTGHISVGQFYNHVEDDVKALRLQPHTFALAPYQSGQIKALAALLMAQMPYHHEIFSKWVSDAISLDQARWELVWKRSNGKLAALTTLDKTNELKIRNPVEHALLKPFPLPIVIGDDVYVYAAT
ncbi:hypothetical protein SPFM7_00011 [Salmonella phage SPFM7]|nr:hypothetical protein SPFM7_00011 [Salmonella phage SPFM7]